MDYYDDPSAVAVDPGLPAAGTPGFFFDGVIGGTPRTILRSWFMNILQKEIRNVIIAGGLTPDRATSTQLRDAIIALISGAAVGHATTTAYGTVKLAQGSDVIAGTDASLAVTPAALTSALSFGSSGYYKFPGGMILQWGTTSTITGNTDFSVSFAPTFPTQAFFAFYIGQVDGGTGTSNTFVDGLTRFGFNGRNTQGPDDTFFWFAFGN